MDERNFFDKLAPEWDQNEILSTPERVRHFLVASGLRKGDSVLDLGTGTGVLLPEIAKIVGPESRIVAIDYSTGMLDIAKKKFSGLIPKPDFLNLDFETETIEGRFNHIYLYCVYPHLHTPIDTLRWLRAVNLEPGGVITIGFPCDERFINGVHREKHSESDCLPSAEELSKWFNMNDLPSEVVEANENYYIINISSSEK